MDKHLFLQNKMCTIIVSFSTILITLFTCLFCQSRVDNNDGSLVDDGSLEFIGQVILLISLMLLVFWLPLLYVTKFYTLCVQPKCPYTTHASIPNILIVSILGIFLMVLIKWENHGLLSINLYLPISIMSSPWTTCFSI